MNLKKINMNIETFKLLILFGMLVYVIASTIRWLLKLFGYGYPYYMNITYTKNNIKRSERFYIVDKDHLIEIMTNIYDSEDE